MVSARCALAAFLALGLFLIPIFAGADDLGSARLLVAGTRLAVSPEAQTVPYRTPTLVETHLEGFGAGGGALPLDLKVVGDFTGPEIDGILRLETSPGEPFRIPRLSVEGQYQLDDIRLVQGDELLAYAEPRSAGVLVTQVLVTRVTSRALTLDEIRSYGLVIDDDHYHAFNFTFGFAVDGEVFDYNVPVIASPGGSTGVTLQILEGADPLGGARHGTTPARFRPPRLAPFTLELDRPSGSRPTTGGCLAVDGCQQAPPISQPGVILFPTDVSLLNQFFSVVVIAKNDAPAGDRLVIRDLTAKVSLPPGLRLAETEPPTPLGVPVPVRVPGADGKLGTADDITFLIAQAEGQAEVLVEGRKQGTHVVELDLQGVLDGFPDGEIRKVSGKAKGAVVVRDPTLGLSISHPDTVRADEEYSLFLTLSNTGNVPVNLLSLTLPTQALSGVQVIGSNTKSIASLGPGEADTVEFRLRSLRTGRVTASTIKAGSQVSPSFELAVGVGDSEIPLSPDTIVLPKSTKELPDGLSRQALGMIGLGYSLATAPASALRPELPQIELDRLHEKVYWLSQAGRHVDLGEDLFDSTAVLAAEWTGARDGDREWDLLRRVTERGAQLGTELGAVFAAEASASSEVAAFERFAATTAFLGPVEAALATGDGASLEVSSRTSGKVLAGNGADPQRSRALPFADLYDLDGAEMALLAMPEDSGYRVRITDSNGGSSSLRLLVPEDDGTLREVTWSGLSLSAAGSATVEYRAADTSFTLAVDSDGDGTADDQVPGSVSTIAPRPFEVIGAVQDPVTVTGHTIDVLFTQDVDIRSLLDRDPSHFVIPGKLSNGGLVKSEADVANLFEVLAENPFAGLMNTRVVRVSFDNGLSPYRTHDLTVNGVESVTGELVTGDVVPVETRVTDPGTIVQGTVYGPDGEPVPFARVELLETDFFYFAILNDPCKQHRTALMQADAQGRFEFDYVRQTMCGDLFRIRGSDPLSGQHGTSQGRVRFVGQTVQLDVLMLGRGTVRGRVTYEDGTVPGSLQVVGYSPVFYQGSEAELGPDGTYEIRDLPVGTISLGASDRIGSFVYQTVEIPRAGAVVERDLTIFRRPDEEPTGDVRGTVLATDQVTPVIDAYVALYVDGELAGIERSGYDGTFDFATVRAGVAEIEAFDGSTGLAGAQVFFDVEPDQVNDVTVLLQDDRGTVEGYVYRQTLSDTTPLEGAVVWVSGTPFNTVTDENGFYRIEGVYAGTRTILAADLERQVQASAKVAINSGGETVYRDLYFVESVGSGLAGELLGLTGSPVAGATIHLADGHGGWWRETITGLDGRFTFPDLEPGSYRIHAYKGTLGVVETATIRFEGETPFVQMRFQRGTIRGSTRIIGESGQLTGVTALVTYRTTVPNDGGVVELDLEAHTLETEADGSFEIPDVLAGRYVITVSNAFHGEKTVRDQIVYDGEVRQHDFLFQSSGTVRGTLLDWDGETPVAGAVVNLRHPAFSQYDLTTDEEGRFAFELVPPRSRRFAIDAEIEKDGIFRTARIWVGLTQPGQELDVEVVLPMQGTVSGWVEDSNGAVVPGAVVTLREGSFPNRKLIHNADADGTFVFTNVFAGDVSLSAQAPSLGGLGGRDTVEIIEEAQEVFGLIVLEATGEIEGAVFSPETGEEVSTAQVTLQRWPTSGTFDSVTASEGEFRFRLLPLDMYRVRIFDPSTGRFGQSDWTLLDTNGDSVRIDVTLQARGDVDGHLTEPESGLGVPGATIRLYSRSLRPFTTYSSTDVDGYFEFLGIPEGSFDLRTTEPGGRRLASGSGEIVEEDERVTVDLVFEELGRVVGTVLNPPGLPEGPFTNANVVLYESGRAVGASLDNPFTFDGVLSGRTLEVRAFENGGDHRSDVKGKLAAGEGEITLDLRMVARGSAAVTVVDSGGAPMAGASVVLRNKGYYGYKSLQASTGPDGRAVFQDLGAGWITASASHPGSVLKGSARGDLTLEGEQVEMVIELEPSGVVRGRALLSDGATPATDGLVVVTRGSRTLQLLVDESGDFEFASVPLGSFTLFVQESFGPGTIERSGTLSADGEVVDVGTLVLDDHDPAVFSMAPVSGSADLPLSTVATVRFSEPVDTAKWSGSWITFRKVGGSGVGYTPSWSEGDTVLSLTPNNPLASFTAYDLIVNDAYDLAGRRLSVKGRTSFNTVDVVPPAVVEFLPREDWKQVPLDASVLVTFSEPVVFASLSGSALQLTDLTTGAGVTTTFQHLAGERQVLVTPASGLEADRQYQLTVQNVVDGGGNAMAAPATLTFWSVDLEPPEITSVVFPEGTSYTAGDAVPVQVEATDEWGVVSTELVIEGWSWSDAAEPWEITGVVPITAAAGQLTVEIRATDVYGNTGSVTRTLDVVPNPNAVDPAPTVGCGLDGGWVVPGYAVELGAVATDDETVESIALYVDGVEIGQVSPLATSPAEASFLWTPPAGAAPGTSFAVTLEARDFAGNVGTTAITLATPPASAILLTNGTTLFPSTYDGGELVLVNGTFEAVGPLDLASLTVARAARIVPEAGTIAPIDLTVAGRLDVQCGGRIDVSEAGYSREGSGTGKSPDGIASASGKGGGSHGGHGTVGTYSGTTAGDVYDSLFEPSMPGAAGSGGGVGAGGGIVRVRAGSLELDGSILATGETRTASAGGGAGGSVWIDTGLLAGSGAVDASGGDLTEFYGSYGAGGGGRIAVYPDQISAGFSPSEQLLVRGGKRVRMSSSETTLLGYAAPGTLLVKAPAEAIGTLYLSNGLDEEGAERTGAPAELPHLGGGPVFALETVGADTWVTASEPFRPRWIGAWMVLVDGAGSDLGTFRVDALDGSGRARLAGAGAMTGAIDYRGEWRFDRIEVDPSGGLESGERVLAEVMLVAGEMVASDMEAETLVVSDTGLLTAGSTGSLRIAVSGTVTIEPGARIDTTAIGHAGGRSGSPEGEAASGLANAVHGGGGSHGGKGGAGEATNGASGEVFDSIYEPRLAGGGGASSHRGGAGGGVIEIEASGVVVNGRIRARGEGGVGIWDSGGAGGSIVIRAQTLSGSGVIDASGGDPIASCRQPAPGAGGGGRIALWVDDLSGFDLEVGARAWGGALPECGSNVYAAPGTVFVREAGATYGRLLLNAGQEEGGTDRVSPATELPALGTGLVAAFEVSGADAWLTAATPFRDRWIGTWVVLLDAGGGELGVFRAQGLDGPGRALLEGAGGVGAPASYRGEYRFDGIETLHGAGFEATDAVKGMSLELSGDSPVAAEVFATDVVVKSGAVMRPASGDSLRIVASGMVTIEESGRIDATGLGYAGGRSGSPGGEAPEGVVGSSGKAGGSHGGAGDTGEASGPSGEVYDSVYAPTSSGGGGATSYSGGAGGGVIQIEAEGVVLDGEIRARGETRAGNWNSGGAGGTITIRAGSLEGAGLLDVGGADTWEGCRNGAPGAGGGGRIALYVGDLDGFDAVSGTRTWGGALIECSSPQQYGAPGTLFSFDDASTFGDLRVDQGQAAGAAVPPTVLPAIGKGTIASVTPDGPDAWIEDAAVDKLFAVGVVGMSVRIEGLDYLVTAERTDRRGLLLQGGATTIEAGDAYIGVYKFDSVTVAGGAHLVLRDEDETAVYDIEPGSDYTEYDLDPPAVVVTAPAAGAVFTAGDAVSIAADVTDVHDIVSVTFRLGDQSFVDTEPPYVWATVAPAVETEADVPIEIDTVDSEANAGTFEHSIHVLPIAPGDPPAVAIDCLSPGLRLAPGTGIDLTVSASHDDGVERVELFVGGEATPSVTDFTAPYELRFDVPAGAADGDVVELRFRARGYNGVYGEVVYPVRVVAGNVVTADTFLASADLSLDDASLVVAGGTLTIEGPHTFRDLTVLPGASVTHPETTATDVERLEVSLTRDLFVTCGGTLDGTAKGYPGGRAYPADAFTVPLLVDDFSDGDSDGWIEVDEPVTSNGPSHWYLSSGALYQSSNIVVDDGSGRGTYVFWDSPVATSDYRLGFDMKSSDDDWLGAMFRYVDGDNYYRFGWTRQTGLRFLERVENGVLTRLAQDDVVYTKNVWYAVEIVAEAERLELHIDGELIFSVRDDAHPAGSVGFFSAANAGSRFDDVRVSPIGAASITAGGAHGAPGGLADGTNAAHGNLFDPRDAGSGGGATLGSAGGGVVRVSAAGAAVIDGTVAASGGGATSEAGGAGGSVRIDAASIVGVGSIDASGGETAGTSRGAGGGGRIALYSASIDDGLLGRTSAAGGDAATPVQRGAAGTIYVKRDGQALGDLILDNDGLDSAQPTELLGFVPGVLDAVGVSTVTDDEADFIHDLAGLEVFFEGDDAVLWPVAGNDHHGQTLLLDTSAEPLTALAGDGYEGLYRFDRVIVRGGAEARTLAGVDSVTAPEVEAGSSWSQAYLPTVTITAPLDGETFVSGSTIAVTVTADDLFGADRVEVAFDGLTEVDITAPFEATFVAPIVTETTDLPIVATLRDRAGHQVAAAVTVRIEPVGDLTAPVVSIGCPSPGLRLAPGTGIDFAVTATHEDGIERVELFVDGGATPSETWLAPPYDYRYDVPAGAADGDVVELRFRARGYNGVYGAVVYPVRVVAGNVVTADTLLDSSDLSFDGTSVVVAAGTLTIEGPHTFRDLTVLSGASVTHPEATATAIERLDLALTRDLFVACGGSVDVDGAGYPGGGSYEGALETGASIVDDFSDGDAQGWQVVDEGTIDDPSDWYIRDGAFYQGRNIYSSDGTDRGTFAYPTAPPASPDYRFGFRVKSTDDDMIGAMFRYVDPDNYYRFAWRRQGSTRFLEKVVGGVRTRLAEDSVAYVENRWYALEIVADASRLEVRVDGERIFEAEDAALPTGSVALFVWGNAGVWFDDVRVAEVESRSISAGGSHGGLGGGADVPNRAYGSLFDPEDPGAGGGGASGSRGGGVVRIGVAGDAVVDGTISAAGRSAGDAPAGAGGSVRLDASTIAGYGTIDASGGGSAAGTWAAGGGGRIALYGTAIDPGLVDRTLAAGGDAATPAWRGGAGTIFVERDSQALGDLILDNGGQDTDQTTELLGFLPGVLDDVGVSTVTDDEADFVHDLTGLEVFFAGDDSVLWPIAGHDHHGQTLTLDTSALQLTALAGDGYEGLYRFDRVIVRGGAEARTLAGVDSVTAPEVEAGSSWAEGFRPTVTITEPVEGEVFVSGSTLEVSVTADDLYDIVAVELAFAGGRVVKISAPFTASFVVPIVTEPTYLPLTVTLRDRAGHEIAATVMVEVDPVSDLTPPLVSIGCPSPGARLAPGTGLDFAVTAAHDDGIERLELFVDGEATPTRTWLAPPYDYHYDVPAQAADGDVIELRFRALGYNGNYGEAVYPVKVVAGNVVTTDTLLSSADLSLDDSSVVVAGGTLTIEGAHTFRDLVVLPGAAVTHPTATTLDVERLELALTRDLFVACGAAVDATAKGYPGGVSYHADGTSPFHLADDFDDGDYAGWTIVDEGTTSGPSNWHVAGTGNALYQTSNIYTSGDRDEGTYALWSQPLPTSDYRIRLHLYSGDNDGIGVMFRYTGPEDFYRFYWDKEAGVRRLERVEDGVLSVLSSDSVVYAQSVWYRVDIVADGSRLAIGVDGDTVFSLEDATHPVGGMALYAWGNTGARFEDVVVAPVDSRSIFTGGSHGGHGGSADGTDPVYGNLFDPDDPGAGGSTLSTFAGGGVIRISAAGELVVDGSIAADGAAPIDGHRSASAGGSVRLDGSSIRGLGSITALGGDAPERPAAGGGGRIALYGATIDDGLLGRTLATGGDAATPGQRGAAGTIYVRRDSQVLGDLILDNGGLDTDQPTELLGFAPGVLDDVGVSTVTDDQAHFVHDLTGMEVFFEGDDSVLWPIAANDHRGQTLTLDTSALPLTALADDGYEGRYRFDRVIVRGGAEARTLAGVDSVTAPEIEVGSSWSAAYLPTVSITSPADESSFISGSTITVSTVANDLFGVAGVDFTFDGQTVFDTVTPFETTFAAPVVATSTDLTIGVRVRDHAGHEIRASITVRIDPQ